MNGSHVAGGSIAALIVYCASRFGWSVSTDEAAALAGAAFGIGAGISHLAQTEGLVPGIRRYIFGPGKKS